MRCAGQHVAMMVGRVDAAGDRPVRRCGLRAVLLLGILGSVGVVASAQDLELRLKAEFIERFIGFVDWPENAAEPADAPFVIGIMGDSPVRPFLRHVVSRRHHRGRQTEVRVLQDPAESVTCDMVFIPGPGEELLDRVLAETAHRPILTIGDGEGFARRGVLVNFYREGDYLRFEINQGAVDRSGLRFSSNLLRLARLVDAGE